VATTGIFIVGIIPPPPIIPPPVYAVAADAATAVEAAVPYRELK
jgi:hypothetical protein